MKKEAEAIRQEILKLVQEYYHAAFGRQEFIPGKTRVGYAGRIFDEGEMTTATDALLDFWLTLGPWGIRFENALAGFVKAKFASVVNSGSSANLLSVAALMSQQLGKKRLLPGDEVVTPAVTFPTTFNPLVQMGLTPVLVDIEPDTYNINTELLEKAIGSRTRLIMIPHTLGNPCDIRAVMALAEKHDLFVIEDACDALGATVEAKMVGTFGTFGTSSYGLPSRHPRQRVEHTRLRIVGSSHDHDGPKIRAHLLLVPREGAASSPAHLVHDPGIRLGERLARQIQSGQFFRGIPRLPGALVEATRTHAKQITGSLERFLEPLRGAGVELPERSALRGQHRPRRPDQHVRPHGASSGRTPDHHRIQHYGTGPTSLHCAFV